MLEHLWLLWKDYAWARCKPSHIVHDKKSWSDFWDFHLKTAKTDDNPLKCYTFWTVIASMHALNDLLHGMLASLL